MLDTVLSILYRAPHLLIISPNPIEAGPIGFSFIGLPRSQNRAAHSGSLTPGLLQVLVISRSTGTSFPMTQLLSSLPSFCLWDFLFLEHTSCHPSLANLSMEISSESVLTPQHPHPSPQWV